MPEFFDFFDPTQNVVLIDATTLSEAERLIESCEACNPDGAEIPFDDSMPSSIVLPAQIRA